MTSTLPSPSAGQEREAFEAWLPSFWSRESFKDDEGELIYREDWVQGAWAGYCADLTSASKQEGGEPSDAAIMALWAACDTPSAENDYTTGPLPFARALLALSAPQPPLAGAGEAQIEAAAKVIAASMDYPWDQMPELGRNNMRKHARAVAAALNPKPAPLNGGCGDGESAS